MSTAPTCSCQMSPAYIADKGLANDQIESARQRCLASDAFRSSPRIHVWTDTEKTDRIASLQRAVTAWAAVRLPGAQVDVKGIGIERCHHLKETCRQDISLGVQLRLDKLLDAAKNRTEFKAEPDALHVFIAVNNQLVQKTFCPHTPPNQVSIEFVEKGQATYDAYAVATSLYSQGCDRGKSISVTLGILTPKSCKAADLAKSAYNSAYGLPFQQKSEYKVSNHDCQQLNWISGLSGKSHTSLREIAIELSLGIREPNQ